MLKSTLWRPMKAKFAGDTKDLYAIVLCNHMCFLLSTKKVSAKIYGYPYESIFLFKADVLDLLCGPFFAIPHVSSKVVIKLRLVTN